MTQSGTWILGATTSVDAVGAYSRAWNLAALRRTELANLGDAAADARASTGDTEGFDESARGLTPLCRLWLLLRPLSAGAPPEVVHVFGAGYERAACVGCCSSPCARRS